MFGAASEAAAVDEDDDRLAMALVGRGEDIEHVALVRAVREVARQQYTLIGLLRLQRRIELRRALPFDARTDLAQRRCDSGGHAR